MSQFGFHAKMQSYNKTPRGFLTLQLCSLAALREIFFKPGHYSGHKPDILK